TLVSGTSLAAPFVTGTAALMFSVNPDLTAAEAKDILLNTADDIYHIPYNQKFQGQLGTGRLNAYRAVLTAKCMRDDSSSDVDLMIRNGKDDFGDEPYTGDNNVWESPDIWVRNQDDGQIIDVNQNPLYDSSNPNNFVYVRITNNGCQTSSPLDQLKLYWAKANTALMWPNPWDGNTFHSGVTMGDTIGTKVIPSLGPGEETIIEFSWEVPDPDEYMEINPNPWHFCLLGRIISEDD